MGFPGSSVIKNLPAKQKTRVLSLSWEDHLEKGISHFSILAWAILRIEEPGGLQSMELQDLDTTEWLNNNSNNWFHLPAWIHVLIPAILFLSPLRPSLPLWKSPHPVCVRRRQSFFPYNCYIKSFLNNLGGVGWVVPRGTLLFPVLARNRLRA